jgi:RNase P subunit RPR2
MKTIHIPGGILHVAESKAKCPHCGTPVGIDDVDDRLQKAKRFYIRHTCRECKGKMDVMYDMMCDLVAHKVTNIKR